MCRGGMTSGGLNTKLLISASTGMLNFAFTITEAVKMILNKSICGFNNDDIITYQCNISSPDYSSFILQNATNVWSLIFFEGLLSPIFIIQTNLYAMSVNENVNYGTVSTDVAIQYVDSGSNGPRTTTVMFYLENQYHLYQTEEILLENVIYFSILLFIGILELTFLGIGTCRKKQEHKNYNQLQGVSDFSFKDSDSETKEG